jgi:hypothetical protein
MNINVSPPRVGFFVVPSDGLRCMSTKIFDGMIDTTAKMCMVNCEPNQSVDDGDVTKQKNFRHQSQKQCEWNMVQNPGTKKKKKKYPIRLKTSPANGTCSNYPIREGTRVRFQTDETGDIAKEYAAVPSYHVLTQEDVVANWWTKEELREVKELANNACRRYLSQRPDYRLVVIRMLIRCGAQKTEDIPELDSAIDDTETEEDEDLSTLVDGELRGLEKRMILSLNIPFHKHKRSINAVLDLQSRLRTMDPSYFSDDQRCRLIATQYGFKAKYATEWARKMAFGDATSVARNFKFDW